MKLVVAIVQATDAPVVVAALAISGHRSTVVNTADSEQRSGSGTILIGVRDDLVDKVLAIIAANCKTRVHSAPLPAGILEPSELAMTLPTSIDVGGGIVFVVDVERFARM